MESLIIDPFDLPDAERTVFAHTGEFITHHIAELDEPDLVLVSLQRRNTLLGDHVCRTLVLLQQRELINMHVVKTALVQLVGERLLHESF